MSSNLDFFFFELPMSKIVNLQFLQLTTEHLVSWSTKAFTSNEKGSK